MPRLLAVGHVTWDRRDGGDVLGGSVTYAALAARRLGWDAAVLTSAGGDFDPGRDLPGVSAFVAPSRATTRFTNLYAADGTRTQLLTSRADPIDVSPLPDAWRDPDALLLCPVAAEMPARAALAFEAGAVGAIAQGWVRGFRPDGTVFAAPWADPGADLDGVHALFVSRHDLVEGADPAALLSFVPLVAVTRGWHGVTLHAPRQAPQDIASLPRPEVDPTGAGDVFGATFLLRYHETGDPAEAAAFAACAASCVVEGVGASTLGDRAEVERRLAERARLLEDGEWDE